MKKLLIIILSIFTFLISYSQDRYYLDTKNHMPLDASACYSNSVLAIPSILGSIKIYDITNNILSNTDVQIEYLVRPKRYGVSYGECVILEGSNSGSHYSLYGYTIDIDENIDSYYYSINTANNSALFFEKIISNQLYYLDCNTVLNTISSVNTSDVLFWEYQFNNTTSTLTNSINTTSIPIDFNNFDIDLNVNLGQVISFRYKLKGGVYSPFKQYTIIRCPPQLLNFTPIETQCSYSNDGGFSMVMDRDLDQERLVVSLFFENDPGLGVFSLLNNANTTNLTNLGSGQFGFTWPNQNLPAKRYKVLYQTLDINANIPDPNDSSWSALEYSPIFTIGSPPPVQFSMTKISDVLCNGANDGTIKINASGGVGNFKYQIYETTLNNTNWTPFTSPFMLNNLSSPGTGNYKLIVRDNNNCTEQQ